MRSLHLWNCWIYLQVSSNYASFSDLSSESLYKHASRSTNIICILFAILQSPWTKKCISRPRGKRQIAGRFRLKRPKHTPPKGTLLHHYCIIMCGVWDEPHTRDIVQNSHVRKKFGGSHGDARKVDFPSSLGAYVLWWVTKIWNWMLFNCTIDERITLSCDMCNVSLRRAAWFDIFMTIKTFHSDHDRDLGTERNITRDNKHNQKSSM